MTKLVVGMEGAHINLDSLTKWFWLVNYLSVPGTASVTSNLSYVGISVDAVDVDWDAVERSTLEMVRS